MKTISIKSNPFTPALTLTSALLIWATTAHAATNTLGGYTAGGGSGASTHYSNTGSLGAIETSVSSAIGNDGETLTSKPGYLGAQYEIIRLTAMADPAAPDENQTGQLTALAQMDDDTTLALTGEDVNWTLLNGPLESINNQGTFQTSLVYQDTPASIRASYQGLTDEVNLNVLNSLPDNYGLYAGDGLPDDWQVGHFGENNPDALPGADSDKDRQDNAYEYYVGTIPTDAGSLFQFIIERVPGEPDQMNVLFHPVFRNRQYTVQYQSELGVGPFVDLEKFLESDEDTLRTVTDLNASDPDKTYRVKIQFPGY